MSGATLLDTDPDGIPDAEDRCPSEAEILNNFKDDDGCPDEIPPKITNCYTWVPIVFFPRNDHTLDADAIEILERLARVLQDHPEFSVELSGHTDDRGSYEANEAISLRRAEVVRDYLIERGIDPDRLTVVGSGEYAPIASNDHQAGRVRNRRVEVTWIKNH